MVMRADHGGGREAAIHSGLNSVLGSHACVALPSYQALPLYGWCWNQKRKDHPLWKRTALNSGGLGAGRLPFWAPPPVYRTLVSMPPICTETAICDQRARRTATSGAERFGSLL